MYEKYLELLEEKNCRNIDVSKATGIPPSTFSDWKKGKSSPKLDKLKKIADYFNVQVEYLTGESEYRTKKEMFNTWDNKFNKDEKLAINMRKIEKGIRIPVLGNVAAGIPIEAIEDILEWEDIDEDIASKGQHFGLKIKGDSMSPRILNDDIVIVRSQPNANSGDIVIAKVNSDDACCKKLIKHDDGISLVSFNQEYEPMYFSKNDINKIPVDIIGVVIELRAKL